MAAREPTSEVELTIECNNLRNMDTFSKSDPIAVVYSREGDRWSEVGRTEIIWDNLNPKWSKSFQVRYFFEREQLYRFEVYDIDDEKNRALSAQDFIGTTAEIRLSEIVTASGGRTVPLVTREGVDKGYGTMTVTAEEMRGSNDQCTCSIRGVKLAALDWFGSSDPILVVHKGGTDGRWVKVYESAPIKSNVNPRWPEFRLGVRQLCNNEHSRPILFEVLDWESSGAHRPIGYHTTTLEKLASGEVKMAKLRHPQVRPGVQAHPSWRPTHTVTAC
jgi:Ca2+-dependent lipid-binding protein